MNAMVNFTLKSLRANKVRTLVTIGGVALAAALLMAVLTSFSSLSSFLYKSEEALNGSWMAEASSANVEQVKSQLEEARETGGVISSAVFEEEGFGQLSLDQESVFGQYLPIISASGDVEDVCALRPSEGRMPETSEEIILFKTWKDYGKLNIGDSFTIPVGERRAKLAEDETGSAYSGYIDTLSGQSDPSYKIEDGTILPSSMGYLDSENDGGIFDEELVNVQDRTFTVVGFFESNIQAVSLHVGIAGVTVQDNSGGALATNNKADTDFISAFVTIPNVSNSDEVKEHTEELFPGASVELHSAMLRYMGIRSGGAIWDTFYGIAAVLAIVIAAACVSLIYNAFAISVSERTTQFGLLASVGATKRQLRRSVIFEGLIIAVVGIPLGILVGLGGCAITFSVLGPSIVTILGDYGVPFEVDVSLLAIVVTVILTFITVFVSVFVPAIRAGSIGIIDSLRGGQTRRASKKGIARSGRNVNPDKLWKNRGLAGRVFGIGGTLARINKKRGVSKGVAASVSLALAIVLLMTAGSLNTFLGTLVDVANVGPTYDVGISTSVEKSNVKVSEVVDMYKSAYEELSQTPDVEPRGWCMYDFASMIFSKDMLGESLRDEGGYIDRGGIMADGSYGVYTSLTFLDDASFDSYLSEHGLNVADYHSLDNPKAIATGQAYANDGNKYQILNLLQNPGEVRLILGGTYNGRAIDGIVRSGDSPEDGFSFTPYVKNGEETVEVPIDEVDLNEAVIDVAYLADEPIEGIVGYSSSLQLIMPMSAAYSPVFDGYNEGGETRFVFKSGFDAVDGNHEKITIELEDKAKDLFNMQEGFEVGFFSISDYVASTETNQMLATIINVFCLLFTVILALIAMANVFNTITNSLILRRREFAVMESIGMSARQFRSMIIDECVGFGLRGLIPGLIISAVVSYLLFYMVSQSMSGLGFGLPWGYVCLALAMTGAAIVISVVFGLHCCKADNVVETLRTDNI